MEEKMCGVVCGHSLVFIYILHVINILIIAACIIVIQCGEANNFVMLLQIPLCSPKLH